MSEPNNSSSSGRAWMLGLLAIAALALVTYWMGSEQQGVEYVGSQMGKLPNEFYSAIQAILVVALLIERAVDVFLKAARLDPVRMTDEGKNFVVKTGDVRRPATIAALVLGIIAAAAGVRILETLIHVTPCDSGSATACVSSASWFFFRFTDIAISAGILAGGSQVAHPLIAGIIDLLNVFRQNVRGETSGFELKPVVFSEVQPAITVATVPTARQSAYSINVARGSGDSGTLTFSNHSTQISTTCWWDPSNRIAAGTYTRGSATLMHTKTDPLDPTKKRKGVYLPDAKSPQTGNADIFIHEGKNASWSDGCIVIERSEMERLWAAIEPKDGFNVTVVVT